MENDQIIEMIKNEKMDQFEKWISDKKEIDKDLDINQNKAIHYAAQKGTFLKI